MPSIVPAALSAASAGGTSPARVPAASTFAAAAAPAAVSVVLVSVGNGAADTSAGPSPLEVVLRQLPVGMTRYLPMRDLCNLGATNSNLRTMIGDAVLPARLLGVRAGTLREEAGDRFHRFIWQLAALAPAQRFQTASNAVHRDAALHGPLNRMSSTVSVSMRMPFPYRAEYYLQSQWGGTCARFQTGANGIRLSRNGRETLLLPGRIDRDRTAIPVTLSPDGRYCTVLTENRGIALHLIHWNAAGVWRVVSPRLPPGFAQVICHSQVTDRGCAFLLTRAPADDSVTLHAWMPGGRSRSVAIHDSAYDTIAAVSPDGRTLVLAACETSDKDTLLIDFQSGDDRTYAIRRLPGHWRAETMNIADNSAFSPDGKLLALACAANADIDGLAQYPLFFIDIERVRQCVPAGATIDLQAPAIVRPCRGRTDAAFSHLVFSPQGNLLQIPDAYWGADFSVREARLTSWDRVVALALARVRASGSAMFSRRESVDDDSRR